ncbi:MAG: CDP-alcohol phosphatidyltransferase family protein [Methylothermaceae bacterium]|nr:CDP-alcohol phosphatidyltransferase family protein [Methylothermaceae bacterium]
MSSHYFYLIGEEVAPIWGLTTKERFERILTRQGDWQAVTDLSRIERNDRVLLLRADYLLDERIIQGLLKSDQVVLVANGRPVAAMANGAEASEWIPILAGETLLPSDVRTLTPAQAASSFHNKLRKASPPFALEITPANIRSLEHHLFNEAYKGVTDLITKWVWPRPAEQVVRGCVKLGIRPNHVTAFSWVLVIAATGLFVAGQLGWGLLAGWLMTFLDTVDGKLARVTLDASKLGHYLDHILDIVHPPFWYLAWGLGLAFYEPVLLKTSVPGGFYILLGGYVGGRAIEGLFKRFLGRFGIFSWRPVDSISRLITARRNPCLILLTLGLVAGRPDLGLEAVILWTLLSTAFLLIRLTMGIQARLTGESLESWLQKPEEENPDHPAVRWFAPRD